MDTSKKVMRNEQTEGSEPLKGRGTAPVDGGQLKRKNLKTEGKNASRGVGGGDDRKKRSGVGKGIRADNAFL